MLGTVPNAATSLRARSTISMSRRLRPADGSEMVKVTCSASFNDTGSSGRKTPFSYTASTFCCTTEPFYRSGTGCGCIFSQESSVLEGLIEPLACRVVQGLRWHARTACEEVARRRTTSYCTAVTVLVTLGR